MKKKIRFSVQQQYASADQVRTDNVLPNQFVQAIGPFVFLQHVFSCRHSYNESYKEHEDSHPHRGIATLTYILCGEVEHLDSIGNHVTLKSGGMHWMNAGKGIVHSEAIKSEFSLMSLGVSVVRFWINLPSNRKGEKPDYFCLHSSEIPIQKLEGDAGWIKILLGRYRDVTADAVLPSYSKEFLYHIHLEAGKQFSVTTDNAIDYATFLPSNKAVINDIEFQAGKLVAFTSDGDIIELYNSNESSIDIIQFGGECYSEPIVVEGSFVMNTAHEISQAYNDFYDGKYGEIKGGKNTNS